MISFPKCRTGRPGAGHSARTSFVSETGARMSERTTTRGSITMTITAENTRPLPLIGQSVGQAQAALTRLLTGIRDADLTIMLAAHRALRRDLTRLARAAARPAGALRSEPARRRSVAAGWELFKHELHLHHTAEDEIIWPALRPRLAHREHALSVLDAMEEEHARIDPLLAAVDAAFAGAPE